MTNLCLPKFAAACHYGIERHTAAHLGHGSRWFFFNLCKSNTKRRDTDMPGAEKDISAPYLVKFRTFLSIPCLRRGHAICRIFSEKTGSCGTLNLERKRGVSELRKAESTAVMTGSDRWDAAIGILFKFRIYNA